MKLLTFRERLLYAMDKKGVNASDLARMTETHPSQMSRYTSGKTPQPSRHIVAKLANKLGANSRWLEDGTGPVWEGEILGRTDGHSITALAIATTHINSILSQLIETSSHDLKLPETVKLSLLQRFDEECRIVKHVLEVDL